MPRKYADYFLGTFFNDKFFKITTNIFFREKSLIAIFCQIEILFCFLTVLLFVKLLILNSHETKDKEYIDDMQVTKNFTSDDELVNCTDKEIVYHTSKEEIYSEIRHIFFS